MTETACHLAILAGIMAFERRKTGWLALICLAGVFAKETSMLVMIPWIAVHALRDRRKAWYLLAVVPALVAYAAAYKLFPAPLEYNYYYPGILANRAFAVFTPASYGVTGLFHVVLAQLPFWVAGAAWLWMRLGKDGGRLRGRFSDPALLLIPLFWWLGMTMNLTNNTGRFIFMAFPALILFELRVIREIAGRLGLGSGVGETKA